MFVYRETEVQHALKMLGSGVSRTSVSKTTGISRSTLRRWELGHTPQWAEVIRPQEMARDVRPFYAYLLGVYLGDGHLANAPREVFRLDLTLDVRYPNIVEEAVKAISIVRPDNRVLVRERNDSAAVIVGCSSKQWPLLLPQHGKGLKHRRRIALLPWQAEITHAFARQLIRGLIHSDGCRFVARQRTRGKAYEYARYAFSNRSADIRRLFTDACDLLDVEWRPWGPYHISVARRDSVAILDSFIGPKA